ncbi:hypothetical protein BL253_28265 [Pseudofrankia asymbiotica]|uniref:Uncharacterized protein n=1 Tax=Pseudofrankia asymbiotica TaxID=1834516 RepID=A0A1V2I401_9ACTN|nr:hypothetical protein BL253_28265 [Pseudofrankia asymbiotica]
MFDQIIVGVSCVLILTAVVLTALAPVYPSRGKTAKEFATRYPVPAGAAGSPAPGAPSAPGTPAPSLVPSAGAGQLPAGMRGTWSGTVVQRSTQSNSTSYAVTITLTGGATGSVVGTSSYPTSPCSGDLTLNVVGTTVEVFEHITAGMTHCFDTTLFLTLGGNDSLTYHFDDVGYGTGDATLTRQG